jgi:hypothetical protein
MPFGPGARLRVIGAYSICFFAEFVRAILTHGHGTETAAAWYSSNLYAEFLAGPTAIGWLMWPRPAANKSEYLELAALAVGTIGPGRWAFQPVPLPVTLILVFPLPAWASIRFVPSVGVSAGMTLGLFAFNAAFAGLGPFRWKDPWVSVETFPSGTT